MLSTSQPAWHLSSHLPSRRSTLREFCLSSWAGQRAVQPSPDLRTPLRRLRMSVISPASTPCRQPPTAHRQNQRAMQQGRLLHALLIRIGYDCDAIDPERHSPGERWQAVRAPRHPGAEPGGLADAQGVLDSLRDREPEKVVRWRNADWDPLASLPD